MTDKNPLQIPVVKILAVKPTVVYEGKLLASNILVELADNKFTLYDNTGLDLKKFIDQKMDCLFEVTNGKIWSRRPDKGLSSNFFSTVYLWHIPSYSFFNNLIKIFEDPNELGFELDVDLESFYEKEAKKTFDEWGFTGFRLDINESLPALSTDTGVFLINEFEFEEFIDLWRLNQKINIEINEGFIRCIRPHQDKIEPKIELTEAQKAELARRQALHQKRLKAYEEMQERIRIRRERGEGPSLV